MKKNDDSLCDYNYSGENDEESRVKKKLELSLKMISQNHSVTRRLISQNWSVTLTVVVKKKKTSTLTLILMNQLTWPLINFLILR